MVPLLYCTTHLERSSRCLSRRAPDQQFALLHGVRGSRPFGSRGLARLMLTAVSRQVLAAFGFFFALMAATCTEEPRLRLQPSARSVAELRLRRSALAHPASKASGARRSPAVSVVDPACGWALRGQRATRHQALRPRAGRCSGPPGAKVGLGTLRGQGRSSDADHRSQTHGAGCGHNLAQTR